MKIKFTKMQALGNDYIIIDGYKYPELLNNANELAISLSNRHFGIGGDGIIFALSSNIADTQMRMFNSDGSEAEMCGNGIRQLARFVYKNNYVKNKDMKVETKAGIKKILLKTDNEDKIEEIIVNMGEPILQPELIPVNAPINDKDFSKLSIRADDRYFDFTFVSMGNPHAITFVNDIIHFPVEKYGKIIENNTNIFPKRTNVEFVEIINKNLIKMRVWERGAGETLACGTGACASVVACVLNNLTERNVSVQLLGGDLYIEWLDNNEILMHGNSEIVFEGEIDITF